MHARLDRASVSAPTGAVFWVKNRADDGGAYLDCRAAVALVVVERSCLDRFCGVECFNYHPGPSSPGDRNPIFLHPD